MKKKKNMDKKKAVVLFSGGKDSALALYKSVKSKKYKIIALATILPKKEDSLLFHKPDKKLLKKQAKELGLKLITQRSSVKNKGQELLDLKKLLDKIKKYDKNIEVVIIGGIKSSFQGKRFSRVAEMKGFKIHAPLWNYTSTQLWKELLQNKFKIIITKISSEGLSKDFLGKIIDKENFEELKKLSDKFKFHLDFEGGEAETAVLYMPLFKKRINIKHKIKSDGEYRHFVKGLKIL